MNKEENKAEDSECSESSESANSNESRVSSSGSCCTRLTGTTTTTTTTTTTSSNLDSAEGDEAVQYGLHGTIADTSNSICERIRNLSYATGESNVLGSVPGELIAISPGHEKHCDNSTKQTKDSMHTSVNESISTVSGIDESRTNFQAAEQPKNRVLNYSPSSNPKPTNPFDTNNNKDGESSSASTREGESSSGLRRSNFSKSASGGKPSYHNIRYQQQLSKTFIKTTEPPHFCDRLARNCQEKEHTNRRQFMEHYHNSRTRLPSSSSNTMSSMNINTPLNRLSECDAITKRLLSSPIRKVGDYAKSPERRIQIGEIDASRRASLGTNTLTDQISSLIATSHQYNSLELSYRNQPSSPLSEDFTSDLSMNQRDLTISPTSELDIRLKHNQGRSLSVCHEETQKSRFGDTGSSKNNSNYHRFNQFQSSNLNRAASLACDSSSSKRLLTIIPLFGCDIVALEQFMKFGLILPPAIDSAVDHILAHGIKAIGIFRKSGVRSRILTLRQRIESNQDAEMNVLNDGNEFSIYDIADLIKMWFRELRPAPMMTKEMIKIISEYLQQKFIDVKPTDTTHSEHRHNSSHGEQQNTIATEDALKRQIMSAISPTRRALFSKTLIFFSKIASNSVTNQMTSQNLAICLTPSLCATDTDQNSVIVAQKALKYCLDNYKKLV